MENRSFDNLFGTYPGALGIPMDANGDPTVNCNPDPESGQCLLPYHDTSTVEMGGPHDPAAESRDLDGGQLDGFIKAAELGNGKYFDPEPDEVMAYHTCAEVPTYCSLASQGVLADNFFAATSSWSTMAHLFLVSGWSAACASGPMSCVPSNDVDIQSIPPPDLAWTDITYLLHHDGISWAYYVYSPTDPLAQPAGDGDDESAHPDTIAQVPGIWNPLPLFDDVRNNGQTGNIQDGVNFEAAAAAGTLPAVSWVIPAWANSDHPQADLKNGQIWVAHEVAALRSSPDWPTTVLFIQWDEWGGFYDHVVPPVVDQLGYGFRSPMIMLSPFAHAGKVDHQLLSSDAELKFIEDVFLGSSRLDPTIDGRPDSRPSVREAYSALGDLRNDLTVP
jgi:phospholipase C